jgi:hypothetical protein
MFFQFGLDEQYRPAKGTVNGLSGAPGASNALEYGAHKR